MDELERLTEPGTDLLRRVDRLLGAGGAPEGHPVWPLLRRLQVLPGEAVAGFVALHPAPLTTAGHAVRQLVRGYDEVSATLVDQGAWDGAAASAYSDVRVALLRHLEDGPESLIGRLESTAGYADAIADWIVRSRLALARTLADVLGSAEAVRVVAAGTGTLDEAVGANPNRAAVMAAAEIGTRVLRTLSVAYDGAETLLRQWSRSLAESSYRPPAAGASRLGATTRIGR